MSIDGFVSPARYRSFLGLLGLAGAWLVLLATPLGTGVSPDSVHYLDGARNLAAGRGYVTSSSVTEAGDLMLGRGYSAGPNDALKPITHWPPFYSMVLAGGGWLGMDPWAFSRWLNALLLAGNLWLVAYLARRFARVSMPAALFVAFVLLTSWQFLNSHIFALSEPLFCFLILLATTQLLHHLESPAFGRLMLCGIALALANLTRYFGLPLIAAAVVVVALYSRTSRKQKVVECVAFLTVALSTFAIFSIRNRMLSGSSADMPVRFQGAPLSFLTDLLTELSLGFIPRAISAGWFPVMMGAGALLGLAYFGIVSLWRHRNLESRAVPFVPVVFLFTAAYLAFLVFAVLFISLQMRWEIRRYLGPALPLLVLLAAGLLAGRIRTSAWTPRLAVLGLVACGVFGASNLFRAARWCQGMRQDGQHYTSRIWQQSPTLEFVRRDLPQGVLFSNGYEILPFYAGRPARPLPIFWNPVGERPVSNTNEQFRAVRERLAAEPGFVVWFNASGRKYMTPPDVLQRELGLTVLTNLPDGVVLSRRPVPGTTAYVR